MSLKDGFAGNNVAQQEQQTDYPALIAELKSCPNGEEKAVQLLHLLNTMKQDRVSFYDLFSAIPYSELQESLRSSRPLLDMCQASDGTYYFPYKTGLHIENSYNPDAANNGWRTTLQMFHIWTLSHAISGAQERANRKLAL